MKNLNRIVKWHVIDVLATDSFAFSKITFRWTQTIVPMLHLDQSYLGSHACLKMLFPGYTGSPSHLDTAEHFLHKVISIPSYVIRIDVMLLREEFDHAMSQIDQSIAVLQKAMKGW